MLERYETRDAWERACSREQFAEFAQRARQTVELGLPFIARECEGLAATRGLGHLNERDHLDPVVKRVLPQHVLYTGGNEMRVSKARKAKCEEWPKLGNIDYVLESGATVVGLELKAGADKHALAACAWDAVKLGFLLERSDICAGFLLAITTSKLWCTPIRGAVPMGAAE